jgi:hypothetical protein
VCVSECVSECVCVCVCVLHCFIKTNKRGRANMYSVVKKQSKRSKLHVCSACRNTPCKRDKRRQGWRLLSRMARKCLGIDKVSME